jgi:hypothetical protein
MLAAQRQRLLEALPGWTWNGYEARRRRGAGGRGRPGAGQADQKLAAAAPMPVAEPGRCPDCQYLMASNGHRASCA